MTTGTNGGRFQKLRNAMLECVTEADVQAIVAKLIDMARAGDIKAATLLFSQIGKPVEPTTQSEQDPEARRQQIIAVAERVRAR